MANKEGHVEGVPRVRGLRYELISYFDKSLIAPCVCVLEKFEIAIKSANAILMISAFHIWYKVNVGWFLTSLLLVLLVYDGNKVYILKWRT